MPQIHIKQERIENYHLHDRYIILSGSKKIGKIIFKKKNKILIIGFIDIYPEYRNHHYGYQIIEYMLFHYKVHCIVGEALNSAKGFWNKCIKRFDGQRRNISISNNCSSSFVIPRYKISNDEMYKLLEIASDIIWDN